MAKSSGTSRRSASGIYYLPCEAEPGMFRGELLVYVNGLHPQKRGEKIRAQMLVDEREVAGLKGRPKRNNPAQGWLRVSLANTEGEVAEVVLPQPAQPVGERLLVQATTLKKAVPK